MFKSRKQKKNAFIPFSLFLVNFYISKLWFLHYIEIFPTLPATFALLLHSDHPQNCFFSLNVGGLTKKNFKGEKSVIGDAQRDLKLKGNLMSHGFFFRNSVHLCNWNTKSSEEITLLSFTPLKAWNCIFEIQSSLRFDIKPLLC